MKNSNRELKKTSLQNQIKKLKKTEDKYIVNHKKLQNEINGKNKEIKQKDNLLERIFSNTHILIAYLDNNFNFIQVNNTYAHYNKKTLNYYFGKKYFDLYPYENYRDIFDQVVKTGKPYIVFEEHFSNKNMGGKNIYWDWSLHPVKNKNGEVDGVILTLLDVTKRVKAQRELEKTKEKLNQAKRLSDLGLLAATVAHELRNPLSVIQAALYNINRKKENAPIDNQIQTIEKKIMESEQIISNLLAYAKIKIPDFKKIDIIQLLDESIDAVARMFQHNNINVNKIINQDFIRFIQIDPYQIKEVFNNILLNSFQSINKKKGEIDIVGKTIDSFMEITIIDNGSGIKKNDLINVFKPFFTRKSRGTGLGLSICHEIINLHHGSIVIESKVSKGTKIIIRLPYQELLS